MQVTRRTLAGVLAVAFAVNLAVMGAGAALAFYEQDLVQTLFWLRLPGDTLLGLGALVFAVDVFAKLRRQRTPDE
ncbi:hypothetical protein U3A55_10435 [Salarchaeum sp. III]|uniref:hypothetical protein n=1 Tax=Salarchaeum sp. III TaxID=3107927 RepID=UPI002ED9213D